ncbi:MAG: C4-type zinc ribbon domain-containing protein [Anaerolineae bacterium]|nr:C4-type zinc ribbon domain-containing protein [Anaerolineae bacterium]
MSEPFKLFRLQQVDSQIDEAKARLREIENILNDDAARRQAEKNAKAAEEASQEAQKALRRAEEEVKSQQIKIEHNQAALYGGKVSNPKELQDLQNEAEALKRHLTTLEDTQLEIMMRVEEAEEINKKAAGVLENIENQRAEQKKNLSGEATELESDVARYEQERAAAIDSIPGDDLRLYDKLRKSKNGVAVASVHNKTCGACGSELPQAIAQAARSATKISHCDTCGRILYGG